MKTISPQLDAHLSGQVLTVCYLWSVTRNDGEFFGFTDHDATIIFGGKVYQASTGFSSSTVQTNAALSVDNLEVMGFINSLSLTEQDLDAGLWDYASIKIELVNWADLTMGSMIVKTGTTGNISLKRQQYVAELRGLSQAYTKSIGQIYSPSCRADLGDAKCKVNMAPFTFTGAVSAISTDNMTISSSAFAQANDYFQGGKITFTSGLNAGLSMEIKTSTSAGGSGFNYNFLGVGSPLPGSWTVDLDTSYGVTNFPGQQRSTAVGVPIAPPPSPLTPTMPGGIYATVDLLMSHLSGIPTEGQLLWSGTYTSADTFTYSPQVSATFLATPFMTPWAGYDSYMAQMEALFQSVLSISFWDYCTTLLTGAGYYSGSNDVGIVPMIPAFTYIYASTGSGSLTGNAYHGQAQDTLGTIISDYWVPQVLVERVVAGATSGTIVTQLPLPYGIAPGDTFTVQAGCDKSLSVCNLKFNNVVNFRGEPYLPGQDQVLQVGGR